MFLIYRALGGNNQGRAFRGSPLNVDTEPFLCALYTEVILDVCKGRRSISMWGRCESLQAPFGRRDSTTMSHRKVSLNYVCTPICPCLQVLFLFFSSILPSTNTGKRAGFLSGSSAPLSNLRKGGNFFSWLSANTSSSFFLPRRAAGVEERRGGRRGKNQLSERRLRCRRRRLEGGRRKAVLLFRKNSSSFILLRKKS